MKVKENVRIVGIAVEIYADLDWGDLYWRI